MGSNIPEKIVGTLLEIGAVKLNLQHPFTWASGWHSPIYCDNRLTLSFPETRKYIQQQLVALIEKHFSRVEGIAGVATAGIPQGVLVADSLNLPFMYVRSKPKAHGMTNLIEGEMLTGSSVVVVEDLISTGGSSLKAVDALKAAGYQVLGLVAIFSYGFPIASDAFSTANIPFHTLSNYNTLINIALRQGIISEADIASLHEWRLSPDTWKR